jgi:hypothetical protein
LRHSFICNPGAYSLEKSTKISATSVAYLFPLITQISAEKGNQILSAKISATGVAYLFPLITQISAEKANHILSAKISVIDGARIVSG